MSILRISAATLSLALLALLLVGALAYFQQIGRDYERISGKSQVLATADGVIEYSQGGAGPSVLVVHGSGGGYDQGELIAQAVLGDAFRWIAPSRFGYLRSTLPDGATFDDQARAYAKLLDHLGVERVAVVALSHGGPSALLFAALYPERVSALVLLSCGVAASSDAYQAQADRKGAMLTTIFRHDPLYWSVSTLFRQPLMKLMGANAEVVAGLSESQRRLVDRVIDEMNPVAPRSAGVAFDNRAAMPNQRITSIRAPTLILHAADDTLQLYRNAEFAAAHIRGARLVRFDRGGHLLIAVEQEQVAKLTRRFIIDHARR
jgi:pimeloyl-ACP methyl ester carboxylesterase